MPCPEIVDREGDTGIGESAKLADGALGILHDGAFGYL
jgi:hypothetical protein